MCYSYRIWFCVVSTRAHIKNCIAIPPLPLVLLLLFRSFYHKITTGYMRLHIQTHFRNFKHIQSFELQTYTRTHHTCTCMDILDKHLPYMYALVHLLFWPLFKHVNFNNSKNSKTIVFAMHIRYFMYSDFICTILPHRRFHFNAISFRF